MYELVIVLALFHSQPELGAAPMPIEHVYAIIQIIPKAQSVSGSRNDVPYKGADWPKVYLPCIGETEERPIRKWI